MSASAEKDMSKVEAHATVVGSTDVDYSPVRAPHRDEELEYVPDGGREAWTVVLGSTLALFASAGMINAYVSLYVYITNSG